MKKYLKFIIPIIIVIIIIIAIICITNKSKRTESNTGNIVENNVNSKNNEYINESTNNSTELDNNTSETYNTEVDTQTTIPPVDNTQTEPIYVFSAGSGCQLIDSDGKYATFKGVCPTCGTTDNSNHDVVAPYSSGERNFSFYCFQCKENIKASYYVQVIE